MWQQVPDDIIMMSRDISETHNFRNAMEMKLGQEVLGQEKIPMSRSVDTRWEENLIEHVPACTWWRHDDVTWHFWKAHFLKCYQHETWSVDTRWKENLIEHVPTGTWWRHNDVTWHFQKTHFAECYDLETWSVDTRWKENSDWPCASRYFMRSSWRHVAFLINTLSKMHINMTLGQ